MIDIEAELDDLIERAEALQNVTSGRQQAAIKYAHRKLRVALRYQITEQRAIEGAAKAWLTDQANKKSRAANRAKTAAARKAAT